MTAVGYGDKLPKGALGKLIGAVCAISGIVVPFCFPTPVLLSHFEDMYKTKGDSGNEKEGNQKQKEVREETEGVEKKQTEIQMVGKRERVELYI